MGMSAMMEIMMKVTMKVPMKAAILLSFLICTSGLSYAGGNHFHPVRVVKCKAKTCTGEEIKPGVTKGIKELSKWSKIDAKWIDAQTDSITHKTFEKSSGKKLPCWVAKIFLKDDKKGNQYHYVFFTESGKVFRANSTGVLK